MKTTRYSVNTSNIVFDVFEDGEAAVINLITGTYYSLTGSAQVLWPTLVAGATLNDLVGAATCSYRADTPTLTSALEAFLAELENEGLIQADMVEVDDPGTANDTPIAGAAGTEPFVEPRIERFDDLQELILLDPVHDVTDAGWPHAPGQ